MRNQASSGFEDSLGGVDVRLGPISKLWVEDGVLHTDDVLKAKFHEQSQLWQVLPHDTYWPVMVIESVPTSIQV